MRITHILALIVVAAMGAGVWYWRASGADEGPAYRVGTIDRGDINDLVTATGTLNAVTTVQVGSQISGRIWKLHADFNQKVEAKQLLAEIDPLPFEAEIAKSQANLAKAHAATEKTSAAVAVARGNLAVSQAEVKQAQANVAKAEVNVVNAERNWARNRELVGRKLIAQSEADQTETELGRARAEAKAAAAQLASAKAKAQAAEGQVASALAEATSNKGDIALAEAALLLARTNLSYTKILSPIRGVVISRNVDLGQTVAASFQAPVLFLIANDLTRMWITANVDEADIGRTAEGQAVTFTVDAYPQKKFQGSVQQIRLAPITVQNVVTYNVIIEVDNAKLLLKPGMTANVSILVARREGALRVPNAALAFVPPARDRKDGASESASTRATAPVTSAAATEPTTGRRERRGGGRRGQRGMRASTSAASVVDEGLPEGRAYVMVGDELKPVTLVTGISDGTYTEVVSGALKEGDEVVVGTAKGESDGQRGGSGGGFFRVRMGGRGGRV